MMSSAEGWLQELYEYSLLFVAAVAIIPFVIIAAVALTRPLSDTVIVALMSLVVSVARGVIKLAYIEPNRALEKKDELTKQLYAALLS